MSLAKFVFRDARGAAVLGAAGLGALIAATALAALGCGGARATTDAGARPDSVTLTLGPFAVGAGEERYVCQEFANPFGGGDVAISSFASHATAGLHHLLVFYAPGAVDGALADCSGSEFAPGPYGAQRADDALAYPAGVGAFVRAGDGFRVQAHYLNATTAAVDATVTVRMMVAPDGSVTQHAAVLFFSNTDLHIPAGATGVVAEKRCTVPFDVELLQASGHMHRHGVAFSAATPTATLFASSSWQDVAPALFDPPLHVAANTPITFDCTYDNDGATAVGYGTSAASDEMCIFSAQFYPAPFGGWTCS